jgi:hypothetical protein
MTVVTESAVKLHYYGNLQSILARFRELSIETDILTYAIALGTGFKNSITIKMYWVTTP